MRVTSRCDQIFPRSFLAISVSNVRLASLANTLLRATRPRIYLLFRSGALRMSTAPPIVVPEGFKLHQENSAFLLLPAENGAFLNPVQEFNRDLSVACIRTWSERHAREKLARLAKRPRHPARAAKRRKLGWSPPSSLRLLY